MRIQLLLLLLSLCIACPVVAQHNESYLASLPDSLRNEKQRQVFIAPLRLGEMLNISYEWQKKPGRSQTVGLGYVRRSGLEGGFSFQMATAQGVALRYSLRFYESERQGLTGVYHGPMLMAKAIHFNGSNIDPPPVDGPYPAPDQRPDLKIYVLSGQYMFGFQHVFPFGLTVGGMGGFGARLKLAVEEAPGTFVHDVAHGLQVKELNNKTVLLAAPSIHANISIGQAF